MKQTLADGFSSGFSLILICILQISSVFSDFHPLDRNFIRFFGFSPVFSRTSSVICKFHPFSANFTRFLRISPVFCEFHANLKILRGKLFRFYHRMYFKDFFVKNEKPIVQKFSPSCVKILFRNPMFLIRSNKILCVSIFLFCSTACSFWQTAENTNSNVPHISEEPQTGIPFENKEPETFQAEIVVTNFLDGEQTEKVYFAARAGNKSLTVFNRGEQTEYSILNDGGKFIFINQETKTFRETGSVSDGVSSDETLEFLTTEWLNRKTDASFEKLSNGK